MRTVVIYRSISGFTKKYATWIAEDLQADLYDARKVNVEKLAAYDLILFGGSLHAAGINGVKLLKRNLHRLAGKKLILFAVGASPASENVLEEIKNENFSAEEQQSITFFYLRGGFDYSKLDWFNKFLMLLLKVKLRLKKTRTPDEVGMLAAYSKPLDCTKKANIKPIVECAQKMVQT